MIRNRRILVGVMTVCVLAGLARPGAVEAAGHPGGSGAKWIIEAANPDDNVIVVQVSGTPYQMGWWYGNLLAGEIRDNLNKVFAWSGMSDAEMQFLIDDDLWPRMAPHIPQAHHDELDGIVAGAAQANPLVTPAITLIELHRLLALVEFIGLECTSMSAVGSATHDGRLIQIRVLDTEMGTGGQDNPLITVYRPNDGPAYCNVGFAGLIGSLAGINSEGIAMSEVGLHTPGGVDPGDPSTYGIYDGIPMSLLMKQILAEAAAEGPDSALDKAIDIVGTAPRTTNYSLGLGDATIRDAISVITSRDQYHYWGTNTAVTIHHVADPNTKWLWDPNDYSYPDNRFSGCDDDLPALPDVTYLPNSTNKLLDLLDKNSPNYVTGDPNLGIDPDHAMEIARRVSLGSNLMNVVYDGEDLRLWVAYAEGLDRSANREFVEFDFGAILQTYTLRVNVVDEPWGHVEIDPAPDLPDLPAYAAGSEVTLTAVPHGDKVFAHWEIYDPNALGDANYAVMDPNSSITIVMDSAREVTARFAIDPNTSTLLDDYVAAPDPSYTYELVNTIPGSGCTAYVFDMISQTWLTEAEVDRTQWQHWVIIIKPDTVSHSKALLLIDGGANGGSAPTSIEGDEDLAALATIATATNSVVVDLKMIPNQRLMFTDEPYPALFPDGRKEDELIAYTWDKFLRTGDPNWAARLPMTKAVVRAMDTTEAFCASSPGGGLTIDGFVVAGASKRGWTTWTTAAVEQLLHPGRVVAIIPIVIDVLPVEISMTHHYAALGFWAPAIWDYEFMGIMNWFGTPELADLMALVDPYAYLDRYTMPKYIVNSSGDDFFLSDSSQFYFDDLPGEKHISYVPNTDHGLNDDAWLSLQAYYQAILSGTARPEFSWTFEADGSIHVHTDPNAPPTQVTLWQTSNPENRDFRKAPWSPYADGPFLMYDPSHRAVWQDSSLTDQGGGLYIAQVADPAEGWAAFYVELTFPSGGAIPFTFSTEVRVLPEPPATLNVSIINGQSGGVTRDEPPLPSAVQVVPGLPRYYTPNATATLTAAAIGGEIFVHWRIYDPNYPGDLNHAAIDPNNPLVLEMAGDRDVVAVFSGDDLAVTVQAEPNVVGPGGSSTLTATATGGVEPYYEYRWWSTDAPWTGMDTFTFEPNGPGEYVIPVWVRDGVSGEAEGSATVTVLGPPSVTVQASPPVVGSAGSSTLTATVTGGIGPYDYTWSTGETGTDTITFDPPDAGQYEVSVEVSDAGGPNVVVVGSATVTELSALTPLDDYVAAPDPSYTYELVNTIAGSGYTAYVFDMVSQTWRTAADIEEGRHIWRHWLIVVKPDTVVSNKALLWVSGGSNGGSPPGSVDSDLTNIATSTNTVTAHLRMVPNQPIKFTGETDPRYIPSGREEDELLSYTWDKYLRTGDATWPGQLPMAKAAVKAMDAITDFCASPAGGSITVDEYVVTGASKRGWTTWLTAAVDARVVAIIPVVIDLLNIDPSFNHHYAAYGYWAPAIQDYVDMNIPGWFGTPEFDALLGLVDPYSYRAGYTMPKFVINASGDDFFLPDSSQFYFDDLPGEKHLQYFPNANHGLYGTYLPDSLHGCYQAIVSGTSRPQFSWTLEPDGSIHVQTVTAPTAVKLWQATNPDARDFRKNPYLPGGIPAPYPGPVWSDSVLTDQGGGLYIGQVPLPPAGWTAFFVELTFPSGGAIPFTFTTEVRVVPDAATLTVDVHNPQWGRVVEVDPNWPRYYEPNTPVTLTAEPIAGKAFDGWTIYDPNYPGDANHAVVDPNSSTTIVLDTSKEVEATFGELTQYTLTVNGGTGSGTYDAGTEVQIEATVPDGSRFDGWTGDTANVADVNAASTTVTMVEDTEVKATFVTQYTLTVNGGMGSGTYDAGEVVPIEATVLEGSRFDKWTGDTANVADVNAASTTVTMIQDTDVTATFVDQYTLTVDGGTGSGVYDPDAVVPIVATVPEGSRFIKWTGDTDNVADVTAASTTVTMKGHTEVTAVVASVLSVAVVAQPSSILPGDSCTLSARPAGGIGPYDYAWSNGLTGATVRFQPPRTPGEYVYAVTVTDQVDQTARGQVTVTVVGGLSLVVSATPEAIVAGERSTLSAVASGGVPPYTYVWGNGERGPNISVEPTVTTEYAVTATDSLSQRTTSSVVVTVRQRYALTIEVQGQGKTSLSAGVYDEGTQVTVNATPDDDWTFAFWGGDLPLSVDPSANPITLVMDSARTLTAVFVPRQPAEVLTGSPAPAPATPLVPPGCGALVGTGQLAMFWVLCWLGLGGLYLWAGRGRRR